MAKKVNKKKIVGICPVGLKKTKCPSIKRTRQIRVKLLTLQREDIIDTENVIKLRSSLKERKNNGIAADCETCIYNKPVSAT